MTVKQHIVLSAGISVIFYLAYRNLIAAIVCLGSGLLIDFDHIPEFLIHHGSAKLNYRNFLLACSQTSLKSGELMFKKLYLFLHSYELALILLAVHAFTGNKIIAGIGFGFLFHIIADNIYNPVKLPAYFLIWRVYKKFNTFLLLK